MFAISLVLHLAVFLIIAKSQQPREFRLEEMPVTYVEMVNLPVASPQQGTPAPAAEPPAPAPPEPAAAPPAAMTLPQPKPPTKPQAKSAEPAPQKSVKAPAPAPVQPAPVQPAPVDEGREFNERMERLAEERRQAAAIERLRQKSGGRVGMPGASGTQAGSDYSSYMQSRLKDAFSRVMTSQTKTPELIATITVGADGRIDYKVEKPSGDPLFDDSVARAVTIAGRSLPPPPGGGQFKRVFRFRPEGVGVR